jgi:hypothetical protein
MTQVKKFVSKALDTLALKVPQPILTKVEEKSQYFQGKGWGSATVEAEIQCIKFFVKH